jgi:hypothetical protein
VQVPVDVPANQRHVEKQGEELARDEKQKVEKDVQDVLRQDQGVQGVALVNGVLVVGFKFVKSDDLEEKMTLK